MNAAGKMRVAKHIEIEWLDQRSAPATCPNCEIAANVRQYLDIDYHPPQQKYRFVLQICPHCTARFVDNTHMMDYAGDHLIEIGWNIYQSQVGAGIWPISAPLTRINKPPSARVLEIGGAYGFGLDFCILARGWQGEGHDPSPLAAFGAREMGLNIAQDYFTENNLAAGPWDVAISTEVIEHLEHPPEFLAMMRRAVGENGILLLTTPDAEWITPELGADDLVSLLSPDAHLVLQTEKSLKTALANAGFKHVVIKREPMTLIAYASAAPFALNEDMTAGHAMYRQYLAERGRLSAPASDLRFGFAGRALFEAANDADFAAAEQAWAALLPGAKARFGIDLDTIRHLPEGAHGASLAELAKLIPLGLGMILYARAMHRLAAGHDRKAITPMLYVAGDAVAALQGALGQRSLSDGLSANIGSVIKREILLGLAEAGCQECVSGLIALGDELTGWRGFVALVNADAPGAARALRQGLLPETPDAALPSEVRRNALLSLANLEMAKDGEPRQALRYAVALREHGVDADAIIMGAFTRLVNSSRYEEALAAIADYDVAGLAQRNANVTAGRDVKLALMVLDLAAGDPAAIPGRLAGLEIEPERRDALLMQAFIRLVNASRYDEALAFLKDHDIATLGTTRGGDAGRDVKLALMVLDLAAGDPAAIPGRLAGLEIEPERRDALLMQAFIRLVNASRFKEAVAIATAHNIAGLSLSISGETGADTAIALAVLELAAGNPALVPSLLGHAAIDKNRRDALLLSAFTELVNAARYEEAEAIAQSQDCLAELESMSGEAAKGARLASVMLDLHYGRTETALRRMEPLVQEVPEIVLGPLWVDGFVRLVNEAKFEAAAELARIRPLEGWLRECESALRQDTLAALLILELQQGGGAARAVQRFEDARRGGLDAVRVQDFAMVTFVTLVNRGAFPAARILLPEVEPVLLKFRPPFDDAACNGLFAAGMLFLQQESDLRRAVTALARLRDGLVKRSPPGGGPDPLFWPALRGEVVALYALNRGADATALLREFTAAYGDVPDDLAEQLKNQQR